MNFWTDLIWIGNTLYPRWFVIGVIVSPVMVVIVIGLVVRLVAALHNITNDNDPFDKR